MREFEKISESRALSADTAASQKGLYLIITLLSNFKTLLDSKFCWLFGTFWRSIWDIFLMSLSQDQKMSLSFFHVIKMKRWNAWGSFCFFSNRNNQRANIDVDSGYCLLTVWSLCMWYKVANLIAWKLMGEWLVIGLAIGHSVRRHKEHHTCCFFLFEFNIFFPKLKWVNVNDIH